MGITRTADSELYEVALSILDRARQISANKVQTAQDAMIELRIEWEDLQACLKSRKVDGFELVVIKMMNLSATALAMAAALQARIKNMLDSQQSTEEADTEVIPPPRSSKAKSISSKK